MLPGEPDFHFFGPGFLAGARIKGMGTLMDQTPGDATDLIERLRGGDRQALAALFDPLPRPAPAHGRAAHGRAAAGPGSTPRTSSRRRSSTSPATWTPTCADPKLPPLLWLRLHVGRRLTTLHRQHLGTKMRDAGHGDLALPRRRCPRPARRPWPRCSWASTPRPPRRRSAPSGCCGSRRRSTRSTRSTARCWRCGTSSSSAAPRRPRCWGSARRPGRSATSVP